MKVSVEQLAAFLTTLSGRPATIEKAVDESEDDVVRLNDHTWIQVGAFYAIVIRHIDGRHLSQDATNVYEIVKGLEHLDPDAIIPGPELVQF